MDKSSHFSSTYMVHVHARLISYRIGSFWIFRQLILRLFMHISLMVLYLLQLALTFLRSNALMNSGLTWTRAFIKLLFSHPQIAFKWALHPYEFLYHDYLVFCKFREQNNFFYLGNAILWLCSRLRYNNASSSYSTERTQSIYRYQDISWKLDSFVNEWNRRYFSVKIL